jgi:hypothetical protein
VRTWSGGTHLYFTAPEGEPLRNTSGDKGNELGWKIDTRAHGGYVVAPGSTFADHPNETVRDAPVAPLPGWLAELLRPAPLPPQTPITVALTTDRRGKWLRAAVNGELERVSRAVEGERNKTLYIAAVALGQLVAGGELGEAEVTEWLCAAALNIGQGEREARRTIASGLRAGAHRPRTVAARAPTRFHRCTCTPSPATATHSPHPPHCPSASAPAPHGPRTSSWPRTSPSRNGPCPASSPRG